MDFGEGTEESEAAADHHVAVGCGHEGAEGGAREPPATGAGGSDNRGQAGANDGAVDVERAVAFRGEDLFVGEGAFGKAPCEGFDLGIGDFAAVVLEEAGDGTPAEVEAQEVHVSEVEDERLAGRGQAFVVEGAERGGRTGIHEGDGGFGGGGDECAGAGEVGREVGGGGSKREQVVPAADDASEVFEAEEAIRDAGRRFAVVEAAEGDTVEGEGEFEGGQGGADGVEVEVAEGDAGAVEAPGFVIADEGDAELADSVEVVVEGASGAGGGEGREAGAEVVCEGPGAGPAAGDGAVEHERLAGSRGATDAGGGDGGWRGQDELGGVLDRAVGVEEEDVLGAGADVDGKDAHDPSVARPGTWTWDNALSLAMIEARARLAAVLGGLRRRDTGAAHAGDVGEDPAGATEPEPEGAAARRRLTWRRAAGAAVLLLVLVAGAAYLEKDRLAPEVADGLRATIGDERTARVESWFFAVEDRVAKVRYRLLGGETNPFETEPVRVAYVAREPARTVVVWTGKRGTDTGISPDAFLPAPMTFPATRQLRSDPEPGEGTWTTAGLPRTSPTDPLMAKTFFRPDPSRPYALVGVLLVDARRVRLHLVAGTVDPGGSRGVKGPGTIPPEDVARLVAAWNGGFKGDHGNFGMVAHGLEFQRLRNGLATVCTKKDGTFVMGEYGRDLVWDPATMEACRQNAVLLVDRGEVSKRTAEGNDTWGYVQVNSAEFITWRSAIGVTKDGNLLVAAGNSLSAETLARALWAAGAEYAMQLDINSPYVLTALFFPQPDGSVKPERFLPAMPDSPGRFLKTQERDFMYLVVDESRYR